MMLVAGSTHAVDMITRLYAGQGEVVIVEAPSYVDALHVFRDHQVELHSTPMDDAGIIPEQLAELLATLEASQRKPRFLYTIPNFHNPTGVTLVESRRVKIAELARQYNFVIVEDDVYRDLSFEGSVPPSFLTMDAPVLHIGSFSKTMAPGLRLGWLAGSREAIQQFVHCGTSEMGGGASPFTAQIVAEFCRQGHWHKHVAHLREVYRQRRDTMLAALERYMPEGVRWTTPAGGFFIWLTLPDKVQGHEVKALASERGVLVAAGEGYFVNPADGAHHLRLTYSFAPLEDIDTGVKILAAVIAEQQT
jgi:DNA-binding transcriptional MocR family regulator